MTKPSLTLRIVAKGRHPVDSVYWRVPTNWLMKWNTNLVTMLSWKFLRQAMKHWGILTSTHTHALNTTRTHTHAHSQICTPTQTHPHIHIPASTSTHRHTHMQARSYGHELNITFLLQFLLLWGELRSAFMKKVSFIAKEYGDRWTKPLFGKCIAMITAVQILKSSSVSGHRYFQSF